MQEGREPGGEAGGGRQDESNGDEESKSEQEDFKVAGDRQGDGDDLVRRAGSHGQYKARRF